VKEIHSLDYAYAEKKSQFKCGATTFELLLASRAVLH